MEVCGCGSTSIALAPARVVVSAAGLTRIIVVLSGLRDLEVATFMCESSGCRAINATERSASSTPTYPKASSVLFCRVTPATTVTTLYPEQRGGAIMGPSSADMNAKSVTPMPVVICDAPMTKKELV